MTVEGDHDVEGLRRAGRATDVYEDDDGWTLRTPDGTVGAQFEHTLVVTRGAPIVVTV